MKTAIELSAHAHNGAVYFELPAGYEDLANAELRIIIIGEVAATSAPAAPGRPSREQLLNTPTNREALLRTFDALAASNPFRDIKDPVQWQRDLRDEWERPLPGRP